MKNSCLNRPLSLHLRVITWVVVITQLLIPVQPALAYAEIPDLRPAFAQIRSSLNSLKLAWASPRVESRTQVSHKATVVEPRFSKAPTDAELFASFILPEPLLPMGRSSTVEENQALAKAMLQFHAVYKKSDDTSALTDFLKQYPDSPWRVGLLVNLGLIYRQSGYITRALEAWEEAWALGKNETGRRAKALVDRGVGQLAEWNSRLGRYDRLEALLSELNGRTIVGPATEDLAGAREGLWFMNNRPEISFLCGPRAVANLYSCIFPNREMADVLKCAKSTRNGTSLAQISKLADEAGLDVNFGKRMPGARVLVPSVVHWKAGHFAALVAEKDGRYLVKDPTFDSEFWVSKKALDEEGSGYFLIANMDFPEGWTGVKKDEADQIWGKGICNSGDKRETRPCDKKVGGPCDPPQPGMARYSVHALLTSLNIIDTPVSYTPPRGPSIDFTVTYNQREAGQPANLNYPNIGSKWSFGWLAFIEYVSDTEYKYVTPGGGYESFLNPDLLTGVFETQRKSRTRLQYTGVDFVLTHADGSRMEFTQRVDGLATRWFLTRSIDPQGNALTYTYEVSPNLRLAQIDNRTDSEDEETATARATLDYSSSDPLKIEEVTIDSLGLDGTTVLASRSATLGYNGDGYLASITDAVGLVSQFEYETESDFVNAMITPYGKTTFSKSPDTGELGDRWLTVTDPLGQQEVYLYKLDVPSITSEPVPTGMGLPIFSSNLRYRNSFYWDKSATQKVSSWAALEGADYLKAHIFHWLHSAESGVAAGILESEKKPLENRIWYVYPGQGTDKTTVGSSGNPSAVGRVISAGVSQVSHFTHNDLGKVLTATDPLGRKTTYIYNANMIDLEEVRQSTGVATSERLAKITYNTKHQPLTVRGADGQKTTFTYNTYGQVETVVNAKNETTTFTYSSDTDSTSGFLYSIVLPSISGPTPAQRTITFAPDSFRRVGTVTDGDLYAVSYAYDNLDRVTTTTYPDTTTEQIVYKRLDPVLVKDRMGRWSAAEYDPLGRVVLTRDAQGRTTRFDYCSCNSLASLTDPLGQTTTWLRDLQGRVTDKIFPDASKQSFTYEPATGRLKTITDAKGQVTTYNYFLDNNLELVTYSGSAVYTPKVSFAYDPNYNRLTTMWDGTGKTTYSYKPISALSDPTPTSGELTAALGANELKDVDGPLGNDTITYAYDELGRVNSRTVGGKTQSALFDALGRVTQIANPLDTFTYVYESASSRLTSISRTGGEILALTYFSNSDAQNKQRLQTILNKKPNGTAVSQFDYEYTTDGQIKNWVRQFDGSGNTFYGLRYDAANQLVVAGLTNDLPTSPGSMVQQFVYSYDAAGNRLTEYSSAASSSTTRTHNNLNQLTKRTGAERVNFTGTASDSQSTPVTVQVGGVPAKTTLQSGTTYTFDGHGVASSDAGVVSVIARDNVGNTKTNRYQVNSITASGVTKTINYDLNGNTTSVTAGNTTDTYEWDAVDRMVAMERYTSGARVSRSEFTYDGLGRRVKIVEKDAGGNVTSTKRFVWAGAELCQERDAGGGSITKQFFAQGELRGTTKYFYSRDHLGSVREVLDNSSTIVARYDYDPYGNRTKLSGAFDCDFGFTGHYFHAPSGLSLALFRAYDSDTGRWLNRDPIEEEGGINLYAYVQNDPINSFDPYGLKGWNGFWDNPIMNFLTDDRTVNFAAGMGDNLSFGLTDKARKLTGVDDAVDKCSGFYEGGGWAGTAVGLAMGGAHLGRNLAGQAGGNFLRGVRRMAWDNRSWGRVRSTWSNMMGGLRNKGQSLHHVFIPQRWTFIPQGLRNAGFNYLPLSEGFNSWMNGSTALRTAVEWGLKAIVAGAETSPFRAPDDECP